VIEGATARNGAAPDSGDAPRRRKRRFGAAGRNVVIWVLSLAAGVGIWQLVIAIDHPPLYIFPPPKSVWNVFWSLAQQPVSDKTGMWWELGQTVLATAIGWVIGSAAGIVLGILSAEFRIVEKVLFPYLVALQSLPKVALIPLLATWFGFGINSKIALIILLVFFPVMLNTLQGTLGADPALIDLTRSFSAGRWQRLWRIKLPGALNYIFVGLELGIVYAFLGAVLAEMTGSQNGVGVLISSFQNNAATDATFALLIVMAITGFILNSIVRFAHHRVVFWEGRPDRLSTTT
jgi:NitT/TauT family transport system permease protein